MRFISKVEETQRHGPYRIPLQGTGALWGPGHGSISTSEMTSTELRRRGLVIMYTFLIDFVTMTRVG